MPGSSVCSIFANLPKLRLFIACILALVPSAHAQAPRSNHFQFANGALIRGPADSRRLALIFTAHQFAESAGLILDQLKAHHSKATFFLTGDFLRDPAFTPLVRRMLAEGHQLAPHSNKHLLFCEWGTGKTLVSREQFRADIQTNLDELVRLGVPRSNLLWFLPAYENPNADIARWTSELGLTLLNYTPGTRSNADYTGEADHNFVSSQTILDSIIAREKQAPNGLNGFLLLMHLGAGPGRSDKFAARFGDLLKFLSEQNYKMVRVDELLRE